MIPRLCPAVPFSMLPLTLGAHAPVVEFEAVFATLATTKHAIAFPYGRTALLCLLEALGLSQQEVICPSYTCVVVPHAITYSGNRPVFVDCSKDSFLMDLELAGNAVTERAGAIIATSFFGEPVSLDALDALARHHPQVKIIQDCAHSFFCTDTGRPVHKAGIAAIYGLNISKLMTSVFGGMVTTDDDLLAQRLREVRAQRLSSASLSKSIARRLYFVAARIALSRTMYGGIKTVSTLGLLDRFVRYYQDSAIDMPKDYLMEMSRFEAAIGTRQCHTYDAAIAHRRALAAQYHEGLNGCAHLVLPAPNPGHTWSHYTVRTRSAPAYIAALAKHGVELGELLEYFIPDMPTYQSARHHTHGIAKNYIGNVVNLPIHSFVTASDAADIIRHLRVER